MKNIIFDLNSIRVEISFKTFEELRFLLAFCQRNNIYKINIPCKNCLKKDFLLNSIKISREEFPSIDIIPHFSILHEFKRNKVNTLNSFLNFINEVKTFGCNQVLLVSGSQKRSTLDSTSTLDFLKGNTLFSNNDFSIGIAFNPYLPKLLFDEEIVKLKRKLESGLVTSIWIQFGTNCSLLETRIQLLKNILFSYKLVNHKELNIKLFGSILIPSKQFLARFKYRPWKGVYCSKEFLESVDLANILVHNLLKTYRNHRILPIIETDISTKEKINSLNLLLQSQS